MNMSNIRVFTLVAIAGGSALISGCVDDGTPVSRQCPPESEKQFLFTFVDNSDASNVNPDRLEVTPMSGKEKGLPHIFNTQNMDVMKVQAVSEKLCAGRLKLEDVNPADLAADL